MLCLIWMRLSKEEFSWLSINKFIIFSILAVIVFTLVYEVLYLSKEREQDTKMVDQLDDDLTRAEMTALRNELDPHFIFNSLNTLSHLIAKDSSKVNLFNEKLAQVYKYFLLSKDKELIPVNEEIDFIKDYIFLLKIRYDERIQLHINFAEDNFNGILIIPCALQILVENVVKHNEFTNQQPLRIFISVDDEYISIENAKTQIHNKVDATHIGLKNLDAQYLLICKKNIVVEENENRFIVRLPMIKNIKNELHAKYSYYRGREVSAGKAIANIKRSFT